MFPIVNELKAVSVGFEAPLYLDHPSAPSRNWNGHIVWLEMFAAGTFRWDMHGIDIDPIGNDDTLAWRKCEARRGECLRI